MLHFTGFAPACRGTFTPQPRKTASLQSPQQLTQLRLRTLIHGDKNAVTAALRTGGGCPGTGRLSVLTILS